MRKVYLIRHGLPDFPNGEKMCLGTTDLPLSPEGLLQAEKMAAALPPVTSVFSSPLQRSVQTAQVIGLPIILMPGLREFHTGQWDGLTFREIRQRYPDLYEARGTDPSLPLPDAEDQIAGTARFRSAMEEAANQSTGDFAVVAHGGVIARFLQSLGGSGKKPGYAQIISLTYQDGNFTIMEEENHA